MTYDTNQTLRNVYNNEIWVVESQSGPDVTLVRRITLPVRAVVMAYQLVGAEDAKIM